MIEKLKTSNEYTPLLYHKESIPSSSSSLPATATVISSSTCLSTDSPPTCTVTLLLSTFIPSLAGFLCGYDQTIMESILALPNFQRHYFYGNVLIGGLDPFDYITFGYFIMAFFGSLYSGHICDQAGRKRSLVGGFLLFALGAFLDVVCRHSLGFLTGRLIVGFASGILLVAAVCMVTELAPGNVRGSLVGFFSLLTMAGQLAGYYMMIAMRPQISASMSSSSSSKSLPWLHYATWSYGWQTPILFEICISLIAILAQWHLPDSPRWLAWTTRHHQENGKIVDIANEGLYAMAYLQERPLNDPMVQQLWKRIIDDCDNNIMIHASETQSYNDYLGLLAGTNRRHPKTMHQPERFYFHQQRKRRLLLACGLMLANGMTGCDMLIKYYASAIFYASGLHETSLLAANGCTSSIALAVMAISSGYCVDYFGRKGFLFSGGLVMGLCHLVLGCVFQWFSVMDWQTGSVLLIDAHARLMSICCVYVFIITYSLTWGPLLLATTCEWLLVCDRAKGMALVACLAWSSQMGFMVFSRHFFMSSVIYYIFGVSMFVSCYLVYLAVPNTTAKSLEEIGEMVL